MGNFLFGYNLFLLIPLVPNPVVIVMSAVFALLNCILFYAFEGYMLKQALGIDKAADISEAINDQMELIKTVKKINKILLDPHVIAGLTADQYNNYKEQALALNETIKK